MTLHKKPISFALWLGASLVTPAMGWATQVPAPQHTQQSNQCTGTITDEQGEPVIGATIQVKGTNNRVITDFDGHFTLQNVSRGSVLIVSYIGTHALFWAAFTLSVLSVAVVLLRLPRELKV